jgi:hypothetical protein
VITVIAVLVYHQHCFQWALFIAIGVFASSGASGPYTHPLILEMSNMMQERALWFTSDDPQGLNFVETAFVAGIQRHLEVDADDPTRIVDGYLKAWWLNVGDEVDFPSYAFDPHEYLEVHRPQVSNMLLAFYLLL